MEKNNKPSSNPNQPPNFSRLGTKETTDERPLRKSVLGKAYLHRIAREARRNGFIVLDEIYLILAEEEEYSDILYWLWRDFQCNWRDQISDELLEASFSLEKATQYLELTPQEMQELIRSGEVPFATDGGKIFFRGKDLEPYVEKSYKVYVDTEEGRIRLWQDLVFRWAGLGITGNKKPITLLPLFKKEDLTGKLREVKYPGQEKGIYCVKLEDLKEYLEGIQKEYEIRLPLPKRLFGQDNEKIIADRPIQGKKTESQVSSSQKTEEGKFVFRKAGPGWQIVFDGEPIESLRGVGFAYLHHCIENSHKSFSALELYKAVNAGEELNTLKSLPVEAGEDEADDDIKEKNDFRGFQFTSGVPNKAGDLKADEKTLRRIQNRQKEIRDELDEAERNNDVGKMGKLKLERKQIIEYLEKIQWKKGKKIIRKIFSNDETRVSGSIFRAISRALEELRKHNELAYEHFLHAFKPISHFPKKYKPAKKIPWILS